MQVRRIEAGDLPQVIDLFKICLGTEGGTPDEAFWRWKHEQNPFGPSDVLVAFDGDKLIGLRAFMRWEWQLKSEVLYACRAVDTATHPDYRGKGIFKQLTLQLWNELQETNPALFIYNTPNSSSKPGYLKMGWRVLGKPSVQVAINPFGWFLKEKEIEKGKRLLGAFDWSTIKQDAATSSFIHTHAVPGYYAWRYQQIPDRAYGAFVYEKGQTKLLLVYTLRKRSVFYELRICEILPLTNTIDPTSISTAVRKAAKQLGCAFVTYIGEGSSFLSQYISKYIPEVTVRVAATSYTAASVTSMSNWNFSMGDLELF